MSPGAGYAGYAGEGLGAAGLGYGLSMNPQISLQNPMSELYPDQQAIGQQSGVQQGITDQQMQGLGGLTNQNMQGIQGLTGQNLSSQMGINQMGMGQQQGILDQSLGQLNNVDQNQMQQLTSQLGPSGSIGQQLSGEYNNYGLTPNSGGFQAGLANQYGNLAMQQQQQNANLIGQGYGNMASSGQTGTNALSGILGTGTQNQVGALNTGIASQTGALNTGAANQSALGQTGLQNILGLESQGVNTENSQALAQFMQQAGLQQALVGGGLGTIGQSAAGGGGSK